MIKHTLTIALLFVPLIVAAEEPTFALPAPAVEGRVSVEEALAGRRSQRAFASEGLALADVGQLLWAAQGISDPRGLRTGPSAGALYPLEVWLVVGEVKELAVGAYRYLPEKHALRRQVDSDLRSALVDAAYGQAWIGAAAAVLVITGREAVTRAKYGARAGHYMALEAGHAAQSALLQVVALDLAATVVGGFDLHRVGRLLDLDRGEEALLLLPVGRRADSE
jgi:SagB-type dehydrogenase family enzyme